jgi:hypothetical protein
LMSVIWWTLERNNNTHWTRKNLKINSMIYRVFRDLGEGTLIELQIWPEGCCKKPTTLERHW